VLNGPQCAIGTLGEFARKVVRPREEVGKGDLLLAHFVEIGGGDAATGGAAWFFAEDIDAVVFGGEVEQAMGDVRNHGAFVDEQAREDRMAFELQRFCLPPDLTWVSDDSGPDAQVGSVPDDDSGGKEV